MMPFGACEAKNSLEWVKWRGRNDNRKKAEVTKVRTGVIKYSSRNTEREREEEKGERERERKSERTRERGGSREEEGEREREEEEEIKRERERERERENGLGDSKYIRFCCEYT
jgi:hypothetical protein